MKKKYEPRLIGKFMFYQLNNPVPPIEIECFSVRSNNSTFLITKHNDKLWDNYALNWSSFGGAEFYYFRLPTGQLYCSLPLIIKNDIRVYECEGRRKPKIRFEYFFSVVGIKGLFNEVSWFYRKERISSLDRSQFSCLKPIDSNLKLSICDNIYLTASAGYYDGFFAFNLSDLSL